MIENLKSYLKVLNAPQEVDNWLSTTGKKALRLQKTTESEMEHILDYLVSDQAPQRLRKMSFKDAKRKAQEWSESNQKKGRNLSDSDSDIETFHEFEDGSKIVKLISKNAYEREGFLMSHCLGGYSPSSDVDIYSYRDSDNNPHATFEVRKNSDEIVQVKGKGNGPIHPKYVYRVLDFLKKLGMEIRISEMQYLGYYHIHNSHLEFLKKIPEAWGQIVEVQGEYYAH